MSPKFSIIIPAYNVADFIETCIRSVLSQNFNDYEIIIIDDGSTDGTTYMVREFAKEDPRIAVVRQPNAGQAAVRNLGIKRASGEYILFLDGDDFLEPGALQKISTAIKVNLNPDLVRFQAQDFYEDGRIVPHHESYFAKMSGVAAFGRISKYHYIDNDWAYAYRTAFFRQHGFKYAEGRLAEDFGLTPLIIAKATTILSIDTICYNYRQRAGSIMHDKKKFKRRVTDTFAQLDHLLSNLSTIKGAEPIAHYCIVSALTLAAQLDYKTFAKIYREAKRAGFFRYIRSSSLKSLPRAIAAKLSPRVFYSLYHR